MPTKPNNLSSKLASTIPCILSELSTNFHNMWVGNVGTTRNFGAESVDACEYLSCKRIGKAWIPVGAYFLDFSARMHTDTIMLAHGKISNHIY